MKPLLKLKLAIVVGMFAWSAWLSLPQILPTKTIESLPKWMVSLFPTQKINLGLDLQGGIHLMLGVDLNRVIQEAFKRQISSAIDSLQKENLGFLTQEMTTEKNEDVWVLKFENPEQKKAADEYLEKQFPLLMVQFEEPLALKFKLDEREIQDLRQKTLEQSIEVLRNRIDEFGVKEPIISRAGDDKIQVQFPGLTEIDRIKSIISRTAKLEFRMVGDDLSLATLSGIVQEAAQAGLAFEEKSGQSLSNYTRKLNEFAKPKLPDNKVIRFEKQVNDRTLESSYQPMLVEDIVQLSGLNLQDARVGLDQNSQLPHVEFSLNPTGTKTFSDLTKANVGKQMAIVLDDLVYSAPVIRSHIPGGSGVITLGQYSDYNKLFKEASDLVVVLRAGSLPTTLDFLEERSVGPGLGTDSIRAGSLSALMGGLIVLILMSLYYSSSGVLASIMLIFNGLLTVACLTFLGATLTLPGIAGIVLTFGMSVDANIIIFERIRENLRRGRNIMGAIKAGYERAFTTIFDSNITTVFSGVILLQYGTGAIKGFAVTLILGILTSMFTAYFAPKAISEWIYQRPDVKQLRIGINWRQPSPEMGSRGGNNRPPPNLGRQNNRTNGA
jgi:protein-export membrane protein SecD